MLLQKTDTKIFHALLRHAIFSNINRRKKNYMEVKPKQTLSVKVFINSTESINIYVYNFTLFHSLYYIYDYILLETRYVSYWCNTKIKARDIRGMCTLEYRLISLMLVINFKFVFGEIKVSVVTFRWKRFIVLPSFSKENCVYCVLIGKLNCLYAQLP